MASLVREHFSEVEVKTVAPESDTEFDYVGKHLILLIPTEAVSGVTVSQEKPEFFELQIKTLFQHAWAQANHDLGYKSNGLLSPHDKRRIAFTAAQAWGADWIFEELFTKQLAALRTA